MFVLNAKEEKVLRHLEELGLSRYEGKDTSAVWCSADLRLGSWQGTAQFRSPGYTACWKSLRIKVWLRWKRADRSTSKPFLSKNWLTGWQDIEKRRLKA